MQFGTFVTAGSDGTYNFWDKDSKQRLKAMAKCTYGADPAPIPCGAFSSDGTIYAYAGMGSIVAEALPWPAEDT